MGSFCWWRFSGLRWHIWNGGVVVATPGPVPALVKHRVLRERGAEAVHVHEIEIEKRLEDLPLRSLSRDP